MPEPIAPLLTESVWLALVVGNTRLHWALLAGTELQGVWHTPHLTATEVEQLVQGQFAPPVWATLPVLSQASPACITVPEQLAALSQPPLFLASVVPQQTALWQPYAACVEIRLEQLPLDNLYPTLGIDRALNLLGAGDRYGWPVLVIDAGTALTFTAGTAGQFMGGAILPGLALQFKSLAQDTATLPAGEVGATVPCRWARNTPDAIRSGVIRGCLATLADFVADWRHQYPEGGIVLTGGDAPQLSAWWAAVDGRPLNLDADIMFWGMACCRQGWLTRAH